jgi:sterol desaturase/sphingolipid hydroxylase (fatty acid hydroxylase superfamily)
MTIYLITTSILLCWMIFIILFERVRPYRKDLPFFREGFWVDLVWYTLIQSYFLKILIFDYIIQPINHSIDWSDFQLVRNWSVASQVLFFTITHDFYIYWFHRLQHANKFLWRTHEAHHSGKYVDFLQGSRSHILEIIINQTIEFLPIIVLGAAPEVLPIKLLLDGVFGMFIHANIDVKLRKWKYIFNSPELHLWHHANYKEVFHANFSTKFSFWDYLFRTVYFPEHKPENGTENWGLYYDFPRDYFLQNIFAFKRIEEDELLKNKWFKKYYNLRFYILKGLKNLLKKRAE